MKLFGRQGPYYRDSSGALFAIVDRPQRKQTAARWVNYIPELAAWVAAREIIAGKYLNWTTVSPLDWTIHAKNNAYALIRLEECDEEEDNEFGPVSP